MHTYNKIISCFVNVTIYAFTKGHTHQCEGQNNKL